MQIVIEIDEERYKLYKFQSSQSIDSGVLFELKRMIANGIPLPKGHEDLIDRNELYKDLITNEWITDDDGGGLEEILFNAQTIIKADKAENEKKIEIGSIQELSLTN